MQSHVHVVSLLKFKSQLQLIKIFRTELQKRIEEKLNQTIQKHKQPHDDRKRKIKLMQLGNQIKLDGEEKWSIKVTWNQRI